MTRALGLVLLGLLAYGWTAAGALAGEKKGTEVTIDGLKSTAPADWETQKPTNKFRSYQFRIPMASGDKADGELAILNLGGSGGSNKDNIKRWQAMFDAPDGKSIDDVTKVENKKVGNVEVTYVDIQGTYKEKFPPFDPNAKITRRPDYRRINVIFNSPNGPFFIVLSGPANTVAQHKKEFDRWLENFK